VCIVFFFPKDCRAFIYRLGLAVVDAVVVCRVLLHQQHQLHQLKDLTALSYSLKMEGV
jgi:hypothetical protein